MEEASDLPFLKHNLLARGGARVGAGRPQGPANRVLQVLITQAVDDTKWLAILEAIYQQALLGDVSASAFLFDRKFGRPVTCLEMDEGDPEAQTQGLDLTQLTAEEMSMLESLLLKASFQDEPEDRSESTE